MRKKVAIIDSLGAHGSSHHYYLFGQANGLINAGIDVSIYTNILPRDHTIISSSINFIEIYS